MDSYYYWIKNLLLSLLVLILRLSQIWPAGTPAGIVSFWHASISFGHFLSGTQKCFSSFYNIPALESAISARSLNFFNWNIVFKNQDLALGVFIAVGVLLVGLLGGIG